MKLNKIFAICLAALTLTACSDDDDKKEFNSNAGVTVQMEDSEISVMENLGLFDVPIVVNGDANGYIEVNVKVYDGTINNDDEEPAINDAHFFVTSTKCYINPDSKTGNIEIRTQDFRLPQKTRSFTVTIESVKGATVQGNATTTVYILDKGTSPEFAELLTGEWIISYMDYNSETGKYDIPRADRGVALIVDQAKMTFEITNFTSFGFTLPLVYEFDEEINYGDVAMRLGAVLGGPFNFGEEYGLCNMCLKDVTLNKDKGSTPGQWNNKYNAVKFGKTEFGANVVRLENGNAIGVYTSWSDIVLTHIVR